MTVSDAYAALDRAIHDLALAQDAVEDGEVLTHWALAASYSTIERTNSTAYFLASTNDDLPTHVVLGLHHQAIAIINQNPAEPRG
jgi:hypothetical protein